MMTKQGKCWRPRPLLTHSRIECRVAAPPRYRAVSGLRANQLAN
jgi:hypothetical protein